MHRRGPPFCRRQGLRWQYRQPLNADFQNGSILESGLPAAGVDVGGSLRRLREERAFTIRALAEKSGLAVNTLSLIENGKTSPSVSTLQQLALALEVPIHAFFETGAPKNKITCVKAGCRPWAAFEHGIVEDLGAGVSIPGVEPFVVTLEPGAGSGFQDIVHTGYEFVYCLAGQIAYTIDGYTHLIEPGDSILFEAWLPHHWHNLYAGKSQSILVLIPFERADFPAEH